MTLDEVISTMGYEQAYNAGEARDYDADALHYLKEYQQYQNTPSRNGHMALVDYFEESQKNEPLTWDELRTMEGKPVWVEYNFQISNKEFRDNSKRWCIIREFKPWHDTEIIITDNGFVLSKNEQVKDWQAYRKERNDHNNLY